MRSCSRCGGANGSTYRSYCRSCHAAYMRAWRAKNPENTGLKARTRARTHYLVKTGQLAREDCHCGQRARAHHPDYTRPELVEWLCPFHHRLRHQDLAHA